MSEVFAKKSELLSAWWVVKIWYLDKDYLKLSNILTIFKFEIFIINFNQ